MPVSSADARLRHRCPSLRAASPVIHWLAPLSSAVRPSSEAAIFMRTQGRWRCMREKKPMFSSRAARAMSPSARSTWMPAARSRAMPWPATSGFGSTQAITTRAMPASISASQQGGVRPWCAQGSRLTHAVAPRKAGPPRLLQGHDLGMGFAGGARGAAAQRTAVGIGNDTSHTWVGLGQADSAFGQAQAMLQLLPVEIVEHHAASLCVPGPQTTTPVG